MMALKDFCIISGITEIAVFLIYAGWYQFVWNQVSNQIIHFLLCGLFVGFFFNATLVIHKILEGIRKIPYAVIMYAIGNILFGILLTVCWQSKVQIEYLLFAQLILNLVYCIGNCAIAYYFIFYQKK